MHTKENFCMAGYVFTAGASAMPSALQLLTVVSYCIHVITKHLIYIP